MDSGRQGLETQGQHQTSWLGLGDQEGLEGQCEEWLVLLGTRLTRKSRWGPEG